MVIISLSKTSNKTSIHKSLLTKLYIYIDHQKDHQITDEDERGNLKEGKFFSEFL